MARSWGWWTRHKLQILEDYLQAFATTTSLRSSERIYLDLFAGRPDNVSRETGEGILGSAHRALRAQPPFTRVCLFELENNAEQLNRALRDAYPGRTGVRVYPGDCNQQVTRALRDLQRVRWAPTFAFIDQFGSEVYWTTLEQVARFRQGKTKAEMWILFATDQYPRGLTLPGDELNEPYADTITRMLGTDEWQHIWAGRRLGHLTAAQAREEWVNLMRWRLQHELGYAKSHPFTMRNTAGKEIYDMIFTSDHDAGDRIMTHLYGKAESEHEDMRQHALALRRDRRAEERGEVALFPVTPAIVGPTGVSHEASYVYEPPHEPYRLSDR